MKTKAEKGNVFICVSKAKNQDLPNGNTYLQEERAIYYSNDIGRRRNYRQSYPHPETVGMRLKTFRIKENAQELCDFTNDIYNDDFEVIEVNEQHTKVCIKKPYSKGKRK